MQLYRAKVCLAGSPYNQVIKEGLSAAEIIILQRIHNAVEGSDGAAVKEIQEWDPPGGFPKRTLKGERARLIGIYGVNFMKTFPNEFQALPEKLDEGMLAGAAPAEPEDEEEAVAVATEGAVRKILTTNQNAKALKAAQATEAGVMA